MMWDFKYFISNVRQVIAHDLIKIVQETSTSASNRFARINFNFIVVESHEKFMRTRLKGSVPERLKITFLAKYVEYFIYVSF